MNSFINSLPGRRRARRDEMSPFTYQMVIAFTVDSYNFVLLDKFIDLGSRINTWLVIQIDKSAPILKVFDTVPAEGT